MNFAKSLQDISNNLASNINNLSTVIESNTSFKKSECPAKKQFRIFINTQNPKEIFMASIDPSYTINEMNEQIARIYQSNYLTDFESMEKQKSVDVKVQKTYLNGYLLNTNFVVQDFLNDFDTIFCEIIKKNPDLKPPSKAKKSAGPPSKPHPQNQQNHQNQQKDQHKVLFDNTKDLIKASPKKISIEKNPLKRPAEKSIEKEQLLVKKIHGETNKPKENPIEIEKKTEKKDVFERKPENSNKNEENKAKNHHHINIKEAIIEEKEEILKKSPEKTAKNKVKEPVESKKKSPVKLQTVSLEKKPEESLKTNENKHLPKKKNDEKIVEKVEKKSKETTPPQDFDEKTAKTPKELEKKPKEHEKKQKEAIVSEEKPLKKPKEPLFTEEKPEIQPRSRKNSVALSEKAQKKPEKKPLISLEDDKKKIFSEKVEDSDDFEYLEHMDTNEKKPEIKPIAQKKEINKKVISKKNDATSSSSSDSEPETKTKKPDTKNLFKTKQ